MQDLLYKTSIYGPRRILMQLPYGLDLGRQSEITYHFYNLESNDSAPMRAARAIKFIEKLQNYRLDRESFDGLGDDQASSDSDLVNPLLLGLLPRTNIEKAIESGNASKIVQEAIQSGKLDHGFPEVFEQQVLPFRQSPLAGKTIMEIAKDPTAIAVFVVIATKGSPVAIVVLPVGIVAMHVATRTAPRIADWVDNKLKRWLK